MFFLVVFSAWLSRGVLADELFDAARCPKPIYFSDNRYDTDNWRCFQHPKRDAIKKAIDATALIARPDQIVSIGGHKFKLQTEEYKVDVDGYRFKLCKDQRFHDQKTSAWCTGFLLAPDIVVTAGHCLPEAKYVVFGFDMRDGSARDIFNDDEVYSITAVLDRKHDGLGLDYSVVKLNKIVPSSIATPLKFNSSVEEPLSNTIVGVIGHPDGLPKKFEFDRKSKVTKNNEQPNLLFNIYIDTFAGNSGSPVLYYDQPDTVAGILISGAKDFEFADVSNQKCVRYRKIADPANCNPSTCFETAQRISAIPNLQTWVKH